MDSTLESMSAKRIMPRIWARDYTVWKHDPTEISDRLNWLQSPQTMLELVPRFRELIDEVRSGGYARVMLLGMGGSGLAPAVFAKVFGKIDGYPELTVLDNTDPDTLQAAYKSLRLDETLFIVSSKSGTTVETLSLMKFFYARVAEIVGRDRAGRHFVAITDPGSNFVSIARKGQFMRILMNDPNLGGRYSVLSYDGLVPAALMGVDLTRLLGSAMRTASQCGPDVETKENPAARLGATLGELAKNGRDKVTFAISPRIEAFGNWIEQLIAESTGKEGRGILPIVGAQPGPPDVYGNDCLFVSLQIDGEMNVPQETALTKLRGAGHPIVYLQMRDAYELGGQFFLWELATAVIGHLIGVNPFDQPNVESAKVGARKMIAEYKARGRLPKPSPVLSTKEVQVYGEAKGASPGAVLASYFERARAGDYIAIEAYVQPTDRMDRSLRELRELLMARYRLATTLGYGPRFLHSTGQLHKGDAGRGFILQITSEDLGDLPIPDELGSTRSSVSFGVLKEAEALGDMNALVSAGRRVISFHLKGDAPGALDRLTGTLRRAA